jgi:hypothetical protein
MSRLDVVANWLSVIAAFAFAGAVVLPDTTLGSPRSVVMSIAGVVVAVVQLLHALSQYKLKLGLRQSLEYVMDEIDYPRTGGVGVNAPETATAAS